ncbi:MHYT domain-containing protein [Cohnella thermotolerans]|uniref:MHYT domain-containing protein n=1 Tax=Cohnella thermotolerans TaxID=329858 RepID=UPI003B8330DD
MGLGIRSMHLVGMPAFSLPVPVKGLDSVRSGRRGRAAEGASLRIPVSSTRSCGCTVRAKSLYWIGKMCHNAKPARRDDWCLSI